MLTRRATLAGMAALGFPSGSGAQGFPSRSITIIVPYPPGGPVDALARLIAQEAAGDLNQPIVVENRPGGSGIIGAQAVARAEPDGHVLVLGTNQTHATNQSLIKNCPYDAVRDFAPVAGIAAMPHVLVVRKSLALTSVGDVVAMAKAKPGTLTFGSTGNGSGAHLAGELFKTKAGIDMLHVPFKGLSPMLTELLADRIDISIAPLPGLIGQQIESGSVRALGLARAERVPQLASVPTFAESGVPGVEADAWSALFAPARTPAPVIERLYLAIAMALSKDAVRTAMAKPRKTAVSKQRVGLYVSKRDSSDIERAPIGVEHSLLHHLGQRRMREDGVDEFLLRRL
jgi:tripartite-type tricarboxylate transporter receptor subunit TctC